MDRSLPGSSVDGILQARILEQVDISFSKTQVVSFLKEKKKKLCWGLAGLHCIYRSIGGELAS